MLWECTQGKLGFLRSEGWQGLNRKAKDISGSGDGMGEPGSHCVHSQTRGAWMARMEGEETVGLARVGAARQKAPEEPWDQPGLPSFGCTASSCRVGGRVCVGRAQH